jgi:iron complex transport system substrate-binding protein
VRWHQSGQSLYELDVRLVEELAPTLILSQGLCNVCALGERELDHLLGLLPEKTRVLSLSPHGLEDVWENLREIASATGCLARGDALIQTVLARLETVTTKVATARRRPRVFCMEWVDPIFCAGHWVPEMVELAGGWEIIGRKGAKSVRVTQEEVIACAPEVVVVMPCGCGAQEAHRQASQILNHREWQGVPAVRLNQVYAVDAALFTRPSLRLVEGVELLAHLFHERVN